MAFFYLGTRMSGGKAIPGLIMAEKQIPISGTQPFQIPGLFLDADKLEIVKINLSPRSKTVPRDIREILTPDKIEAYVEFIKFMHEKELVEKFTEMRRRLGI